MTSANDNAASRDQPLDTLRGAAIGLVLVGHYLKYAPFMAGGLPLGHWVQDFGQGGVLLFFMLSGYLIYTTAQARDATTFLTKRFAKIAPAYWVNVVFVLLAGWLLAGFPKFAIKDALGNLAFLEGSLGVETLSGVYWTLVVEVKFYLLFAAVFFVAPARRYLLLVPVLCLAANLTALAATGRTSVLLTYLPAFFVGIAFAMRKPGEDLRLAAGMLALAATSLVIGASFRGWPAAVFLVADAGLFALVQARRWALPALSSLGVISYSVYLYHTTLGYPLLEFAKAAELHGLWPAALGLVLALVLAVSLLSYRHIELRFVAVANRLLAALAAGRPRRLTTAR